MKKINSAWTILFAIILAVIVGTWAGTERALFGVTYISVFNILGTIFLNSLMLIVVPLVASSIISGIARIGNESDFGRIGGKTFAFYLGTSLMAILIGLVLVNIIQPGRSIQGEIPSMQGAVLNDDHSQTLLSFLMQIIPPNIIDVFSQGHMLSLIFFSIVFGFAISKIESSYSQNLQTFWQAIFQTMIRITQMIMRLLPYGVFFLVAKTFASSGLQSLQTLALFFLTTLLGLAAFMFLGLPLLLKIVGKVSPIRHFKAMSPALITAFSTSSSSATLPITMDCVEKRAGVSNRICSLVVPLGTSINMSGSALYACVASLFVAQAYGISISLSTQFLVVFLALFTSIGVAGIPSGSLIAIIVILRVIGLPAEGIGLFIAVDRILDMGRTVVNVFSDSCCAVLVARSEGEKVL